MDFAIIPKNKKKQHYKNCQKVKNQIHKNQISSKFNIKEIFKIVISILQIQNLLYHIINKMEINQLMVGNNKI